MDGLRQCRSFSRLGLLSVLLRFAISRSKFQLLLPECSAFQVCCDDTPTLQVFSLFRCPLPVAMPAVTTPQWWMLRPTDQSARQPHRHGRAEAVPKPLQVGTAARAATLCDLPFQISTSCFPSAPCFRSAVTTPRRWHVLIISRQRRIWLKFPLPKRIHFGFQCIARFHKPRSSACH